MIKRQASQIGGHLSGTLKQSHLFRTKSLGYNLADHLGHMRGHFRRFNDHRIARGNRRHHRAKGQIKRIVPGGYHQTCALRLDNNF